MSIFNSTPERKSICETHGQYISRIYKNEFWSSCPHCIRIDIKRDTKKMLVQIADVQMQARINAIDIPPRYVNSKLDNTVHAGQIRNWRKSGRGSLFLMGPVGNGKTTIAIATCIEAVLDGKTARYVSTPIFVRKIRNAWKNDNERETGIIFPLAQCDLLVIDDIGATRGLDSEIYRLHDLIGERYDRGLQTIIASNLTPEELCGAQSEIAAEATFIVKRTEIRLIHVSRMRYGVR